MTTATLPAPPSTAVPATPYDVLELEQQGLFELVDGTLVEKATMGYLAGKVAGLLFRRMGDFAEAHGLGDVVYEISFQCFPGKPNQVRRPDIAFIATGHLPQVPDEGHVPVRPDLVVEVVSPGDNVYELDEKLLDYAIAGVPIVWVVNPAARIARVFRPGRPIDQLMASDALDADTVIPGFKIGLGELLPPLGRA